MDIAQGEKVEQELDHLIERRHDHGRTEEGERSAEEAWAESCRVYEAKRQAELVFAWVEYHEEAAERALANGEAIAERHRAQIEALLGPTGSNGGNGQSAQEIEALGEGGAC